MTGTSDQSCWLAKAYKFLVLLHVQSIEDIVTQHRISIPALSIPALGHSKVKWLQRLRAYPTPMQPTENSVS